jgi:hydroxyacylglutathione hydrolase
MYAIDPAEARPVDAFLKRKGAALKGIFNTHRHFDHTGGNEALCKRWGCRVTGPGFAGCGDSGTKLREGDCLDLGDCGLEVIETPGHTRSGVCYLLSDEKGERRALFTGDTLFVAGCGRAFEETPDVFWDSLQKIKRLPGETLIYCGHDYALENFRFALSLEPENEQVKKRQASFRDKATNARVPAVLEEEKMTNPFLRTDEERMRNITGVRDKNPAAVFAELRKRKDRF